MDDAVAVPNTRGLTVQEIVDQEIIVEQDALNLLADR